MTPLIWAAVNKNSQMVKTLTASGANVNLANKNGYTPLMHAAMAGNTKTAAFLLENGADVNARSSQNGKTALSNVLLRRENVRRWFSEVAETNPYLMETANSYLLESTKGAEADITQLLASHGAVQ